MQLTTFLAAATALCATSASAGCFDTGENWGNHPEAKFQLASACGDLQGTYGAGQIRDACRNSRLEEKSFAFQIHNENGGDAVVTQAQCEQNIGGIIDNCGHGGKETFGGTVQSQTVDWAIIELLSRHRHRAALGMRR
ncbi:MAG: hypothetical protein OHK93_007806 [Ramalina farinacea]|uniref:Uncharacterized protein n=1 Tax=Ramalina farinacea TaxID=258253 RepID=A0AA43QP37_9LECA|nr:hypothetical protein [Ramalina farinacea]